MLNLPKNSENLKKNIFKVALNFGHTVLGIEFEIKGLEMIKIGKLK